jgi:hypothetical protein
MWTVVYYVGQGFAWLFYGLPKGLYEKWKIHNERKREQTNQ